MLPSPSLLQPLPHDTAGGGRAAAAAAAAGGDGVNMVQLCDSSAVRP